MRLAAPPEAALRWAVKPLLWLIMLAPLAWLGWQVWLAATGGLHALGADPAETLVHQSGEMALRLLLATLLLGTLRDLLRAPWLVRLRRLLGLGAFFWALAHLLLYATLELEGALAALVDDLTERPYIVAGAGALALLLPLAITSTRGWQRRLGPNWARLHRLVYPAVLLGVLHLLWQARSDLGEAVLYGAVAALLLGQRVWRRWRRRSRPTASVRGAAAASEAAS